MNSRSATIIHCALLKLPPLEARDVVGDVHHPAEGDNIVSRQVSPSTNPPTGSPRPPSCVRPGRSFPIPSSVRPANPPRGQLLRSIAGRVSSHHLRVPRIARLFLLIPTPTCSPLPFPRQPAPVILLSPAAAAPYRPLSRSLTHPPSSHAAMTLPPMTTRAN